MSLMQLTQDTLRVRINILRKDPLQGNCLCISKACSQGSQLCKMRRDHVSAPVLV